jgi:hypothetical protein
MKHIQLILKLLKRELDMRQIQTNDKREEFADKAKEQVKQLKEAIKEIQNLK